MDFFRFIIFITLSKDKHPLKTSFSIQAVTDVVKLIGSFIYGEFKFTNLFSTDVINELIDIFFNEMQSINAYSSINDNLEGSTIFLIDEQYENAYFPIIAKFGGNKICVSDVHSEKAYSPIEFKDTGISISIIII